MALAPLQPDDPLALNAVLVAARQPIDVICDRSSLILIEALLSEPGYFSALQRRTGLANRLLVARLKMLRLDGIVAPPSRANASRREPYTLTERGRALTGVFAQMQLWERHWGKPVPPTDALPLRCVACGAKASARDIELQVSAAQLQGLPEKQKVRRRSASVLASCTVGTLGPTLEVFGDKWGIEIVLCAFFRLQRFSDIRRTTGVAANILSDRLARLLAGGILRRVDGSGYRLTQKGVDLYGVIVAIQDWADAWLEARYRSPVALVHRRCGAVFHPATPPAV